MKLHHTCEIHVPLQRLWELTDNLGEVASCFPGGSATKIDDSHYDTAVKLRLGPLDLMFRGKLDVIERNAQESRIVIAAKASETRGQGTATSTTRMHLNGSADVTKVDLDTDLMINGRIAQLGRGIIQEVSQDLLGQFISNLEHKLVPHDIKEDKDSTPKAGPSLNIFALIARLAWQRVTTAWLAIIGQRKGPA
jgi:uncharacterized protein